MTTRASVTRPLQRPRSRPIMATAPRMSDPPKAVQQPHDQPTAAFRSLLPARVDTQLRSLERCREPNRDPATALRETVEAIWRIVEQASSETALDGSHHGVTALFARRELVHRGTRVLSAVISRGLASGAVWPPCTSGAIRRLGFTNVAGECGHRAFGLGAVPA